MIVALPLVIPVAKFLFDPGFYYIGSTPAHAVCSLLDPDMQSAAVAAKLVNNDINIWYPASVMSYYLGDFIAFSLPIALVIIQSEECRRYLLLGVIPGFVTLPISVGVTFFIMWAQHPMVNSVITAQPKLDTQLEMDFFLSFIHSCVPIVLISAFLIVMLRLNEPALVKGFVGYGTGTGWLLWGTGTGFGFIKSVCHATPCRTSDLRSP